METTEIREPTEREKIEEIHHKILDLPVTLIIKAIELSEISSRAYDPENASCSQDRIRKDLLFKLGEYEAARNLCKQRASYNSNPIRSIFRA